MAGPHEIVVSKSGVVVAGVALSEQLTIGRHPQADIQLEDTSLSRLHAEITKRGDRILVKSCKQLGGVARAAQRLQLDEAFLEAAIARHRGRKALRLKRKSTVIGKRLRTFLGGASVAT